MTNTPLRIARTIMAGATAVLVVAATVTVTVTLATTTPSAPARHQHDTSSEKRDGKPHDEKRDVAAQARDASSATSSNRRVFEQRSAADSATRSGRRLNDRPVQPDPDIHGWTLADITTGQIITEYNPGATNPSASVIKPWLAADTLRRAGPTPRPAQITNARNAILDSSNPAATALYHAAGDTQAMWRMVYTCGMNGTLPTPGNWATGQITARDIALLGVCLTDGRAAGPTWTPWILDQMRNVHPPGRFGPVTAPALAGADVATKNGWTIHNGQWNVNCLAIVDQRLALGIITRYPAHLGLDHGAALCAGVAQQLATPPPPSRPRLMQ